MKASKFTDAQKAFILKQGADGLPVADICRKAGISQATYFNWKKKFEWLTPPEMRRLKQLEDENAKLRKLVADLSLDREMLQDVILYALSLLDRSNAMRTMIGQLAIAGLTNYKADSEKYMALVDAAHASFSLDTYKAVDDFEKATMAQSTAQMAGLQQKLLKAGQEKAAADGLADQRKLILLMAVTLGSTFLLAANLLTTRKNEEARPSDATVIQAGQDEIAAALRLVDIALEEGEHQLRSHER